MTSLVLSRQGAERALATGLLIVGLLALLAAPSKSFASDTVADAALPAEMVQLTVARSCDPNLYVTGDMVGYANPAEVYAVLCG